MNQTRGSIDIYQIFRVQSRNDDLLCKLNFYLFIFYLRNWHLKFFFRSFPFFLLVPTNTWKSQIYSGFNIKSRSKHLTLYTDIIHIHVSLFILFFFSFFYYSRKKLFYSNTALLIRLIVFHLLDKITDDQ